MSVSNQTNCNAGLPSSAIYILPFAIYLIATSLLSYVDAHQYALGYSVLAFLLVIAIWLYRGSLEVLKPHFQILVPIIVGLLGIMAWIVIERMRWENYISPFLPSWSKPSPRMGFDPWSQLTNPLALFGFLFFRFVGLVVVVPIAEELFWRGFLMRWLISENWQAVPLGKFTWFSFGGVVLLFTAAHPEWFSAAVYCIMLNSLLVMRKDLWSCLVAHATSNLVLGIYILATRNWSLW